MRNTNPADQPETGGSPQSFSQLPAGFDSHKGDDYGKNNLLQVPSISIPKGGGALKSIDEKFEVNSSNGTASLSIPIPQAKSRNEFVPNLSLHYSSGGGNSPFGLGWNISLSSIRRRTDKLLPRYEDATDSDIFQLSGAEDHNSVRIDPAAGTVNSYPRNRNASGSPTNDKRFLDNVAAVQYIATSTGVNDNGLFEMNLHDERYLPFERAGAISSWQIELPSVYAQFDLDSITDLIIQFSYTSRDGGAALQAAASESLQKKLATVLSAPDMVLMRSFSARRDFPTQWYKFLHPANAADAQELDMDITRRLPFITRGRTVKISGVAVLADMPAGASGSLAPLYLTGTKVKDQLIGLGPDDRFGTMLYSLMPCRDEPGIWKVMTAAGGAIVSEDEVDDLILVFYYSLA